MEALKFLSEMFEILGEDIAQTRITDRKHGGNMNFHSDWNRKDSKRRPPAPKDAHDELNKKGELGRGLFSKVVSNPADPHTVKKISTKPMGPEHHLKADGFNQYVRMLVDNDLMDNVHFPKVYKATTSTDDTGAHRNSYTIERLASISSISKEEFEGLVERCLSRRVYDAETLAERIAEACESEYARTNYILMETLNEACELIQAMDKVSDFSLDIHDGNLMVRRTPHGLQLVISDPFGMLKSSSMHKYDGTSENKDAPH